MKLHEIKTKVSAITGLTAMDKDEGVSVLVTGDLPEMVPVVEGKLRASGIPFRKERNFKFKGALFIVPLKNVGTAFRADWEYAQ